MLVGSWTGSKPEKGFFLSSWPSVGGGSQLSAIALKNLSATFIFARKAKSQKITPVDTHNHVAKIIEKPKNLRTASAATYTWKPQIRLETLSFEVPLGWREMISETHVHESFIRWNVKSTIPSVALRSGVLARDVSKTRSSASAAFFASPFLSRSINNALFISISTVAERRRDLILTILFRLTEFPTKPMMIENAPLQQLLSYRKQLLQRRLTQTSSFSHQTHVRLNSYQVTDLLSVPINQPISLRSDFLQFFWLV